MPATPPPAGVACAWVPALGRRLRSLLVLKVVGVTAFTWLFFIAYFHLLRQPVHAVFTMPLTALDLALPLQPPLLAAYLSLWFYVGVAPGLELRFRDLLVYGAWVGAMCLTGLALFWAWPTQVPAHFRDFTDAPGFALLQGVDAAGNACPSMHVATAIFTAIRVHDTLGRIAAPTVLRWGNAFWFVLIAYSTLAVKQHVLLDVLAGALLGTAFALPALRWRPEPPPLGH